MKNFDDIKLLLDAEHSSGLELLYEQYGSKFYAYAVQRWGLSEDDAWEVVYRTLETLVQKIGNYTFSNQNDFDSFIYRVLINYLKKKLRLKSYREALQTAYVDFNGQEIQQLGNGQSIAAFFQEYYSAEEYSSPLLVQLEQILRTFDPLDRDLLLLRAQNYTYEEIAELLHIDNSHLKVRHHRVKKKLMDALSQVAQNHYHGKE